MSHEQDVAWAVLNKAVQNYVELETPGSLAVEWCLVAGTAPVREDDNELVHMATSMGTPFWRITGLIEAGKNMLIKGPRS